MENLPLEKEISGIFEKFPAFPDEAREILAKIAPWLSLIAGVFLGFALLSSVSIILGLSSMLSGVGAASYGSNIVFWIATLILALEVYLYLTAFSPLNKRLKKGWNNLYYIFLLSLVSSLLGVFGIGGIGGAVLGLALTFLIGGWILFQVKPKYS